MTHDELRTKIQHYNWVEANDLIQALDAVVELHKPEHSIRGYHCTFDDELFPCKHHQAIEKELA
jgi:hypothetical protein